MATQEGGRKTNAILGSNKKAYHNFHVDDTLECGISLMGSEVKSLKAHHFSFSDAWIEARNGSLFLKSLQINTWPQSNLFNHEPTRSRRLLAHRAEIEKLRRKVDEKGYTLVPLKIYTKGGLIKIEVGLCKGKKTYDKRDDIKSRDLDREAARQSRDRFEH